jgi:hypothetical protein
VGFHQVLERRVQLARAAADGLHEGHGVRPFRGAKVARRDGDGQRRRLAVREIALLLALGHRRAQARAIAAVGGAHRGRGRAGGDRQEDPAERERTANEDRHDDAEHTIEPTPRPKAVP